MILAWNQWDWDALVSRTRLIGFDLDNTLASSKRPMIPDMAQRFSALTRHIDVAVITGGRWELVASQVIDMLEPQANRDHLHLMPTSGTRYYRWSQGQWRCVFSHELNADQRRRAMSSLERHAREQGLWRERIWGERIEDRGSQITFSVLGQAAPLQAKQLFDPDGALRRGLVEAVAADVPDLQVRAGGYTSVDVSQRGIDKGFAVHELSRLVGIDVPDMAFVGDRMTPEGNDYPAVQAGAMGVVVGNPGDTLLFLDEILKRIGV